MGENLNRMATEILRNDPRFWLWYKGRLVVIISRTKESKNEMFVGVKNNTLAVLKGGEISKTQWTDYMEKVLDLITANSEYEVNKSRTLTH